MLSDVPAPLADVFRKQVTVTATQLSKLLPMNAQTLRAHVGLGHIEYVDFATYGERAHRVFTLEQVLRFINSRSFREVPFPLRPSRQAIVPAAPINEQSFTFRLAMQREAEEAEKRRAYKKAVAKHGHFSRLLPPAVGTCGSPLALAARKRLREDAKKAKEDEKAARAAARAKKKPARSRGV